MNIEVPPGWGEDFLSDFIARCLNNTFESFVKRTGAYSILVKIDKVYVRFISCLANQQNASVVIRLLFGRTHSSYLGAVRFALSTQAAESYMLARGCIEAALYALHMQKYPHLKKVWRDRGKDEESREKARNEFSYSKVIKTLENADPALYSIADYLYNLTIDYGAHPNEGAIIPYLDMQKSADSTTLSLGYLVEDETPIVHSLKAVADVGVCALEIFGLVFPNEFVNHGIKNELAQIEDVLTHQIRE